MAKGCFDNQILERDHCFYQPFLRHQKLGHSFACHLVRRASIVLCLVPQSLPKHINKVDQSGLVFRSSSIDFQDMLIRGTREFFSNISRPLHKANFTINPTLGGKFIGRCLLHTDFMVIQTLLKSIFENSGQKVIRSLHRLP